MLDLHCHILPGVDDGPATLDEALALARMLAADGITHVSATPHCHRHIRMLRADVLPHVERFNAQLKKEAIALSVLPGSEIQLIDTADYRSHFEAGLYCHLGDGHEFTLLELNWKPDRYPPDAPELVAWLKERGMTPILAHPERYSYLRDHATMLRDLVDAGAWLQITVDSLLGNHGPAPQVAGEHLLRAYPEAVLATDAHNTRRCSGLSVGYQWVRERLGAEREMDLRERCEFVLARLDARQH
jgi:protein-tyrosine phosphatase